MNSNVELLTRVTVEHVASFVKSNGLRVEVSVAGRYYRPADFARDEEEALRLEKRYCQRSDCVSKRAHICPFRLQHNLIR